MVRQGRLIAVVGTFLIGCAFLLLVVGCAGTSSEAPKEGQGHTEATKKEQTHSPEATASEEARCQGTRPIQQQGVDLTTNDLPDCPKGGLLLGTDGRDRLDGREGDDEIRGLGGKDDITGGAGDDVISAGSGDDPILIGDDGPAESPGDDVIYGGPGDEMEIIGGNGDDVIYGGDGDDYITEVWEEGADKIYCGKGKDSYSADEKDFVSSSCEIHHQGP